MNVAKNLLSLVCSLFVGQLLFCYGFDLRVSHTICVFVAVASHYFLLVCFFCMNVISYDVARTFLAALPPANTRRRFKLYSYYSWGVPALIVIAANIVDRNVKAFNIILARKGLDR